MRPSNGDDEFWSAFTASSKAEMLQTQRVQQNTGTQLLVRILQEKKKVDGAFDRGCGRDGGEGGWRSPPIRLAEPGTVSCRVPFLSFLIHQRFSNKEEPVISSGRTWPTAL